MPNGYSSTVEELGQVSVWVPIVVGLIGLIGVIISQLVNAWREDRRWKREREIEAIRLRQEDVFKWREIKLRVYAQFLELLSVMATIAHEMTTAGSPELQALYDSFAATRKTAATLVNEVTLVGSGELLDWLQEHELDLTSSYAARVSRDISTHPEDPSMVEIGAEIYRLLHDSFRYVARNDLQMSPSRPSNTAFR